ncbi:MAG TPA: hypothetical protein VE377_22855 [Candidatus Dormibacteraeota bacterium]|nr:hypothetical protein [Candidatus Dormibacteraeota bacterium]
MKHLFVLMSLLFVSTVLTMAQEPERLGQAFRTPAACTSVAGGSFYATNTTCTMQGSTITLNASNWFTTDICAAINSALATAASGSAVTVDARGITGTVACATNPFLNTSTSTIFNVQGQLLLGNALIQAQATWTIPTRFWVRGVGTSSGALSQNTIIQAHNWSTSACALSLNLNGSSTSNCPVLFVGNPGSLAGGWNPTDAFAAGASNLAVDCNSSTSCLGGASVQVQEQGGFDTVSFTNQLVTCVDFDASTKATGTAGISNTVLRNVNCTLPNASNGAVTFNGIVLYATDGIAEISNTSVTIPGGGSNGTTISGSCLLINAGFGTQVNYLHCERATNAITIGPATNNTTNPTVAVGVHGVTAANLVSGSSNSGVQIQNASQVVVQDVALSTSGTARSIIDKVNSVSLTDASVGLYVMSTAGGVLISTSSNTPQVLPSTNSSGLSGGNYSTAPSGSLAYCTNCSIGACSTAGSGSLAVRVGSSWVCK